ncbi:hypothetical protein NM208_g4498 [Fusarium decemcellulare]|uniref:Uncharacterized protein n=1 Tax=Fusarium decemcellulare TaxID=57161 RepID=A0ACC1SKI3_9HYPO|nr:hypothetical protein NM208_g4498 [Fusarium decemcellulare]
MLVEPTKSHFYQSSVTFLGHEISYNEIRMDRRKIAAVKEWPEPKNVKEKGKEFIWNALTQKAFEKLRDSILEEPVLTMFDPNKEIELETDLSDYALGGQIGQRDKDGKLHPIAFYSHKLHGAELNYPIYDKEFLAIIKVYTDHQNISHFATTQELNRRQLRYAEYLCEFDFVIIHRKGSDNGRADAISRRPDYDTGVSKVNDQLLEHNDKGELKFKTQSEVMTRVKAKEPLP